MKKQFVLGFFALGIVMASGCGAAVKGVPGTSSMHAEGKFDGIYHSPAYGRLELTVEGDQVHGLYEGERHYGRIEGTIDADRLLFSWTQWKEDLNGKVRKKTGKGYFKYVVREEGSVNTRLVHWLEGEWGYDNNYTGNPWTSVKLPKKAKKFLTPHDNEGPTAVMDSNYESSAGFDVNDQPSEKNSSTAPNNNNNNAEDDEDDDDSLDSLF